MLFPSHVNGIQIKRWNDPEGLFSQLLQNNYRVEQSIFSRNWISSGARKNATQVICSILETEFKPELGISILYYHSDLVYARLANTELNKYKIVKIDNEFYLQHMEMNSEMFRLDELFNIIIDEPEASPIFLFKVTMSKSKVTGLIGFVLSSIVEPDEKPDEPTRVGNVISSILHVIRMSSKDTSSPYVFKLFPQIEELFQQLDQDPDTDNKITDSLAALFIATGLNNPVETDYYKKQLEEVYNIYLKENK